MNATKMLIEELDNAVATSVICAGSVSPPDALAVVAMRQILGELKNYHESIIKKYKFDKKLSNKLDNIEKLLEILQGAKSPR